MSLLDTVRDLRILSQHLLEQEKALANDPDNRDDFLPNHTENCERLELLLNKMGEELKEEGEA